MRWSLSGSSRTAPTRRSLPRRRRGPGRGRRWSVIETLVEQQGCYACGLFLPLDRFYKDSRRWNGVRNICKECDHRRRYPESTKSGPTVRVVYASKSEKARAHHLARIERDPEGVKARNRRLRAARRARERGAETCLITQRDLDRLVRRHGGLCAYCRDSPWAQWDHVIPLVRGGRHAIGNLVPVCRRCNYSKNRRLLAEWRFR